MVSIVGDKDPFAVSRLRDVARGAASSAWTDLIRQDVDISKADQKQVALVREQVVEKVKAWAAKPTWGYGDNGSIDKSYVDKALLKVDEIVEAERTGTIAYSKRFTDEKNLTSEFVDSWYQPHRLGKEWLDRGWTVEKEARWVAQHFKRAPIPKSLQVRIEGIILARLKHLSRL